MVRSVVALAAAVREVRADRERRNGLVRLGIRHVRGSRSVTGLALHVDVAGVSGGRPTDRLRLGVPQLTDAVAGLAELLRVTAVLQAVPRVGMRRRGPGRAGRGVALGAGGFSRLSLQIPQHPTRRRRRVIAERPVVVYGVFVHTAARKSGKPQHGEAGSHGPT